jgi:hypothetical protein
VPPVVVVVSGSIVGVLVVGGVSWGLRRVSVVPILNRTTSTP